MTTFSRLYKESTEPLREQAIQAIEEALRLTNSLQITSVLMDEDIGLFIDEVCYHIPNVYYGGTDWGVWQIRREPEGGLVFDVVSREEPHDSETAPIDYVTVGDLCQIADYLSTIHVVMNRQELIEAICQNFKTFGGGKMYTSNPISMALSGKPSVFALGVPVEDVVDFILEHMEK